MRSRLKWNIAEPSKMKQNYRLKKESIIRRTAHKIVSNGDGVNYSILIGPFCPLWDWVIVTYLANKQAKFNCSGILIWSLLGVNLARALLIEIVPVVIKFVYRYHEFVTFPCPQKVGNTNVVFICHDPECRHWFEAIIVLMSAW